MGRNVVEGANLKRAFLALSALLFWANIQPASAAPAEPLKLERVVMLMRHGIRPPTDAQPIPAQYSPMPWPKWSVGPGLLTPRGAKGIGLIAEADRAFFIGSGLLAPSGCPPAGQVRVHASKVRRAIQTAHAWVKSVLPGCDIPVQHPPAGGPDPLFHAVDGAPDWFDGPRAYDEAIARAPEGGLPAQVQALGPELRLLEAILGCAEPACDLERMPTNLVERPHDRPAFHGSLDVASTASESLLLEYLEGMPMRDVGWGRASRDDIEKLLILNTTKYKYVDWPPYIAEVTAGPLARMILDSLTGDDGPRITLLAGHDTNVAELGGLLGLNWRAAGYPQNNVPPGSALGFELLADGQGQRFVRIFFRSQTMDQLRSLQPLAPENPPYRDYLHLPGCAPAEGAPGCDLDTFVSLVDAKAGR